MVTIKCDMCGKDILNDDGRTTFSFPKEDCFVCYDICEECSNKVEEFIKASHEPSCEPIDHEEVNESKCDWERCIDCDEFIYTSNPVTPYKLNVMCNKYNKSFVTDIDNVVTPKDFIEIK